jgi:hypothetical protein
LSPNPSRDTPITAVWPAGEWVRGVLIAEGVARADATSDAAGAERVKWKEEMPEVTRFFGIVVRMYFRDHSPAHFHAEYGEYEALVEIETLSILRGDLPRRAMALVLEWAALHRQELRADWERARGGTPLEAIAPLD